jgi:hypothetical protein
VIDLPESDLCLLLDALDQLPPIPEVGLLRQRIISSLDIVGALQKLNKQQSFN